MISTRLMLTALALLLANCATPDPSALVTSTVPTESGFPYVAELMVHRCGTLDCHGAVGRNLRIYGDEGLRLAASDMPCVPAGTTSAEVSADFVSVVGLEPEEMNAVLADHGASPERLALLAKPLGLETHKGGTLFKTGDDSYACMTSWLKGATDTAACLRALPATLCALPADASVDAGGD